MTTSGVFEREGPAERRAVEDVRALGPQARVPERVRGHGPQPRGGREGHLASRARRGGRAGPRRYRAVPARVWRSGVVSMPTRIAGTPRGRARPSAATRSPSRGEPERAQLLAAVERLADRSRHRLGALGVAAHRRGARGLVERGVGRGDDRRAARHRLGDRHPEALEARRVDDGRGAAVEPRELLVGDASEPHDPRPVELAAARPSPHRRRRRARGRCRRGARRPRRACRGSCAARASPPSGGRGRSRPASGPSAVYSAPIPGWATTIRSRGKPSVAAVSSAVNAEFANITPHVAAAFRYLRVCMERVRPVTHSGKCSGTRSWIVVARRPARCGGYIQSVKWSTSKSPRNRSAGGRPSRDQAVRQAWANGSAASRSSTGIPSSASGIARCPAGEVGANATTSSPVARGRLGEPLQRAADVVVHARPLVREGRDVEGDPHGW